jgi:hypothetical protein
MREPEPGNAGADHEASGPVPRSPLGGIEAGSLISRGSTQPDCPGVVGYRTFSVVETGCPVVIAKPVSGTPGCGAGHGRDATAWRHSNSIGRCLRLGPAHTGTVVIRGRHPQRIRRRRRGAHVASSSGAWLVDGMPVRVRPVATPLVLFGLVVASTPTCNTKVTKSQRRILLCASSDGGRIIEPDRTARRTSSSRRPMIPA